MARYTGPTTKKARAFGEAIYGPDRSFDKKKYGPGMHGNSKRRRQKSDYAVQLMEKQKAKYTYGVLEKQFRNLFETAVSKGGVTGEVLLQLLEARLDNVVYRLGLAPTRNAARQLVSHKHILVNGVLNNIPSTHLRSDDIISVRESTARKAEVRNFPWLEWNPDRAEGRYIEDPIREQIPERINEQLIVELYSK
ncbi:UNVERIFIED_CONTAM: hypothetical protein GTU68_067250 [Idotea baltica]|nr:hypothetical protein [Idotea baltica]